MIRVLNINENILELFKDWNFWLSLITGLTAVIALVLTLMQIRLSNKQSLFERRLECYLKIDGLMQLYKENQKLLETERKDEPLFAVDLEFLWLTNNTYLEEIQGIIFKNRHKKTATQPFPPSYNQIYQPSHKTATQPKTKPFQAVLTPSASPM